MNGNHSTTTALCRLRAFVVCSFAGVVLYFSPHRATFAEEEGAVAVHRSQNLVLRTDAPEEDAKARLDQLEKLLAHISRYWGKPLKGKIECFLVGNLAAWPEDSLHPQGKRAIESGFGTTLTSTFGAGARRQARAQVYASTKGTSLRHEAVHAYCRQTFFTVGPLWYAEGMAEVGQYWRPDDPSVNCEDSLPLMLRRGSRKTLEDILAMDRRSAEAYGWAWSLCHLMSHNPNYAERFQKFGRDVLAEKKVEFTAYFKDDLDNIRFEHEMLVRQFAPGYRADLCAWDWRTAFGPPSGKETQTVEVDAARGWQATGLALRRGQRISIRSTGTWRTHEDGPPVGPDGGQDGRGRLVGALMKGYEFGEPFTLGRGGTLVSPGDGRLFVRCQEKWHELADNQGSIALLLPKPDGVDGPVKDHVAAKLPKPRSAAEEKQDAEKLAAAKLFVAKELSKTNPAAARKRLEEILAKWANAKAAAEAKKMLRELR